MHLLDPNGQKELLSNQGSDAFDPKTHRTKNIKLGLKGGEILKRKIWFFLVLSMLSLVSSALAGAPAWGECSIASTPPVKSSSK